MNMQIYEEASEWIILHRSDSLDADAKRRFDAWLRESPHHLRAYLEMSTIWENVPALRPECTANADELIARAREDTNVIPLAEPSGSAPRPQASAFSTLSSKASGLSTFSSPSPPSS